jgi:hypothetical protein
VKEARKTSLGLAGSRLPVKESVDAEATPDAATKRLKQMLRISIYSSFINNPARRLRVRTAKISWDERFWWFVRSTLCLGSCGAIW